MFLRLTQMGPFTRIIMTLVVAAGIFLLLPANLSWQISLLVAWCGGAAFFLVQVWTMFLMLDADEVRERCQNQKNEGHAPMMVGVVLTAFVSIAAVIYLLHDVKHSAPFYKLHLAFSLVTIFSSWFILHTMFAIYYARNFYRKKMVGGQQSIAEGMRFTTDVPPDYWDFLYFSFTCALCYGVTDIVLTSKFLRRIVLIQALLSFFYYTVIIGLVMNVIGTLF